MIRAMVGSLPAAKPSPPPAQAHTSAPPPKGRFAVNIVANLAQFVVNVLVALKFTPFLLHRLGDPGVYGLIPLALQLTMYFSAITLGLNGAVGRFITMALARDDREDANRIFNTALFGSLALSLCLALPGLALAACADRVLHVPAGYQVDARLLLLCTVTAFLLNTVQSSFEVATFCRNRFDLRNLVVIAGIAVRVGLVVLLYTYTAPRVWHMGLAILAAGLVTLGGAMLLWRRLVPEIAIDRRYFHLPTLQRLVSTSMWIVVNQIGTILFLGIDLLVINQMMGPAGPAAVGLYAPVQQWSTMLRSLAMFIVGVFGPTIVMLYARQDITEMVRYARRSVKCVGLAMALPISIICGFATPILQTWLPPAFHALGPLMSLMTIHLALNLGYLPLNNISLATNNVRWPGIVQVVSGLANLGLAILLVGPMRLGIYGAAAAGAITLSLRNLVFTPIYSARILGKPPATFIGELLPIAGLTLVGTGLCWKLATLVDLASWPRLIAASLAVTIVYALITYTLVLDGAERRLLWQVVGRGRRS